MSGMVFMTGKWEGCAPELLELGDLTYIARRSNHQIDRTIAQQEIRRRFIARRLHEQRLTNTRGAV